MTLKLDMKSKNYTMQGMLYISTNFHYTVKLTVDVNAKLRKVLNGGNLILK
jgi:hypothetical protein